MTLRRIASSLLLSLIVCPVWAQQLLPEAVRDVGFDQNLNTKVDLSLRFHDESGATVPLRKYFHKKPVVLAFVYYRCPMLCTLVLNSTLRAVRAISFDAGREYEIVAVSIDPSETPGLGAEKKAMYTERYRRAGTENGWHFLTGDQPAIASLTKAAGFRYKFDEMTKQFVHASGILVLTPEGRISRYFYGLEYSARDLRLALIEASAEKIGTPVDKLLLYCLHYDPRTGKYGMLVMNMLRVGGTATLLALGAFWLVMYWRHRAREVRP